jgi:hypothetical protein
MTCWDILHCYVLGRHDAVFARDTHGLYLRCPTCGRRTQGWSHDPWPDSRDRLRKAVLVLVTVGFLGQRLLTRFKKKDGVRE